MISLTLNKKTVLAKPGDTILDLSRKHGIDSHEFGNYIHDVKYDINKKASENYSWKELEKLAKEFKERK